MIVMLLPCCALRLPCSCRAIAVPMATTTAVQRGHCLATVAARPGSCMATLRCNCTAPRWLPRWLSCAGYAGCHATAMPHCSCCRAVATLHGYRSSCHALATHAPRSRGRRARERRRLRSFGGLLASSGAEKAKISYRFSGAREASLEEAPKRPPRRAPRRKNRSIP